MNGREALLAELVGMLLLLLGREGAPTHARYEKYHELAAGFPPGLGGITYGWRPIIIISYPYTTFYWRHTLRCIGIPQEDEEAQEADEEHYYYFIPVLRIHLNTDLDSCSTLLPY